MTKTLSDGLAISHDVHPRYRTSERWVLNNLTRALLGPMCSAVGCERHGAILFTRNLDCEPIAHLCVPHAMEFTPFLQQGDPT